MKYKKLTPSQLNIMKTLWDKKEPMIALILFSLILH